MLGLLMAVGCAPSTSGEAAEASAPSGSLPPLRSEEAPTTETTSAPPEAPAPDRADELLAAMSVEEKVGQLFMPVFFGYDADDLGPGSRRANLASFGLETPAQVVDRYHLGGVIYLQNNIVTADQVGHFSSGLQRAALTNTGIGLLIAVDQEGGRVNRLTDGVTVFPPAAVLSGDRDAVREAGYVTGRQVAMQGINVVLAPVADVTLDGPSGSINNRSYGDDPAVVSDMVRAAIDGLQSSGVAAAAKHWPGHGSTDVDSHNLLPVLGMDRDGWDQRDRLPFAAAVDEDVSIVLVGHLALPAIDPSGAPATVSSVLIDQLLRQEMGFDGVVMTDALNMSAVDDIEPDRLVVEALAAGADILLMSEDFPAAYDAVVEAVRSGELTEDRLDQAVLRVLRLKDDLGLLPTGAPLR
ncbi:MAG: glycoside hydrolase family 3 protein [Acidimicrobiales bacterium]